jgi:hypothetical protein
MGVWLPLRQSQLTHIVALLGDFGAVRQMPSVLCERLSAQFHCNRFMARPQPP